MKNYTNSDYALNKYSSGIVYRFADHIVEITLADYLAENPGRTAADFQRLKELSDEIYLEQVRDENAQTKKDLSLSGLESWVPSADLPLDEEYIEWQDKKIARQAVRELLERGGLTEVQKRRFVLHIFKGQSSRQIACLEKCSHVAVAKSIKLAKDKLRNIFDELG